MRDASGLEPALSIRHLSKSFGSPVLTDVDLDVTPGHVHALMGENGSGKSTLIKIISGYHRPDTGTATIGGKILPFGNPDASYAVGARFVHQNLGLVDSLSVLDNLLLQRRFPTRLGTIGRRKAVAVAADALAAVSLDVNPEALVGDLTPAERTGVAIARAFSQDARLLVLDEPTATLPEREVSGLFAIIRAAAARGVGVLYVTHRLDEVFELADAITVLRDGRVQARTPVAGLTRQELIRQMVGSELSEISRESSALSAYGQVLLDVQGVSAGTLQDVSLQVRGGEVLGVSGITGSGRETVCATIFGAIKRSAGRVSVGGNDLPAERPDASIKAGVAMIPADRERFGGMLGLTARENLTITSIHPHWRHGFVRKRSERNEGARWFRDLDIRPAAAYELALGSFSGGNQQKLLFAKWLRTRPKVLLIDEPTQGVDIGAKAILHHQILQAAQHGAAALVSSTDSDELAALCNRIVVLQRGRVVACLSGAQVTQANITHAGVAETYEERP